MPQDINTKTTQSTHNFIKNLSFLVLLNLAIKPIWILGIDRYVQNTVGTQLYGAYFSLFNYAFIFTALLDFGLNNYANRTIAQKPEHISLYLPNIFILKIFFSLLYVIVCFIGSYLLNYDSLQIQWLIFIVINQILASFLLFFRTNLNALQFFKADGILSVLDRLLTILFCVLLISTISSSNFGIYQFIYTQTVAYLIALIAAIFWLYKKINSTFLLQKISWEFIKKIVKESYLYASLALLMAVYTRIDAVMLEYMLPTTNHTNTIQSGIYAAAYRLLDAFNTVGIQFAALLLPMFAHTLAQKQVPTQLLKVSTQLLWVISVTTTCVCIVYAPAIMQLFYHHTTSTQNQVFVWLIPAFICISMVYIYGTFVTACGKVGFINLIASIGAILNLVLNYFLIPLHGALGASIATVITQFFIASAYFLWAIKNNYLQIPFSFAFKLFIYIPLCVACIYFSTLIPSVMWWLKALIGVFFSLCVAFAVGILQKKQVYFYLTKQQ